MQTTTTGKKNDDAIQVQVTKVRNVLGQMLIQLQCQDKDSLLSSMKQLLEAETAATSSSTAPQMTMDILAPFLFQKKQQQEEISTTSSETTLRSSFSSEEALSLLGFLVSSNTARYLKPASRAVKEEANRCSSLCMDVSSNLLGVIVSQLSGNDVEVSTNATATLVSCCAKLGPAVSDPAIEAITIAWKQQWESKNTNKTEASTICVRCASAVVDLISLVKSVGGDIIMNKAISCGAMDMMLAMMTDDKDPLLQMSTIELLEQLSSRKPVSKSCAQWLYSKPVLSPLLQMAGGSAEGSADPILGGPALRLLSSFLKLGQQDSSLLSSASGGGEHELLTGFHHAIHNFDCYGELERLALVDAISSFASASQDALELVLEDPISRERWLSLSVAQPKLKAVVLISVAMVIDPQPNETYDAPPPPANDTTTTNTTTLNIPSAALTLKLFMHVGATNGSQDSTALLLSLTKSPLPEIRLASYRLMKAVAKFGTGAQVMLSHTGFYDFLIDATPSTFENTQEGRVAKYEVVKAIMNSEAKGLLAENIVRQLEKVIKRGPHYVQPTRQEITAE